MLSDLVQDADNFRITLEQSTVPGNLVFESTVPAQARTSSEDGAAKQTWQFQKYFLHVRTTIYFNVCSMHIDMCTATPIDTMKRRTLKAGAFLES